MKVYANEEIESSLTRVQEFGLIPDATYVELNRDNLYSVISEQKKLPENKFLLFGFESIQNLWKESEFKKAMTNPNTNYVKMPGEIINFMKKYSETRIKNPALEAAANIGYERNLMSILKHDYSHNVRKVIERARQELKLTGTDDEIGKQINNYQERTVIEPQFFSGVFCDIEGTLVQNNELNSGLVEKLQSYSETQPVSIWTDGDIDKYIPLFEKNKIEFPWFKKSWFKGCEVEIAIDDLDKNEFKDRYGIKVCDYKSPEMK